MSKKRKPHYRQRPTTYSFWNLMMSSPTEPMALAKSRHQLTRMWAGLANIERGERPTSDDWQVCSDAVNLIDTLVQQSPVKHSYLIGNVRHYEEYEVKDEQGAVLAAVKALAVAGRRHLQTQQLRLDAEGITAVRNALEQWEALIQQLPERVIIQCHIDTEKRIRELLNNPAIRQPGDEVIAI